MCTIKVTGINMTNISLNKTTEIICNDGMKRPVDSFRIKEFTKSGRSAEVWFYNDRICVDALKKRIGFENGILFIKVGNSKYNIGDYEEV